MDMELKLKNWLQKMGYDGNMPDSFVNICTPSTTHIWEQLMDNAKPKQEVDHIKNNIIINQLKHQENDVGYRVEEIEIYQRKQKLQNELKRIKEIVKTKEMKVENLSKMNDVNYITIQNIKHNIKQIDNRCFLLKKKKELLEKHVNFADQIVSLRSMSPVELDENMNTEAVTNTLKKCAEQLEIHLKNIPAEKKQETNTSKINSQNSTKKNLIQEKYLGESHKKQWTSARCSGKKWSCLSIDDNKENRRSVKKNLLASYADEKVHNSQEPKKKNRESLGILPEYCLRDDDNFLMASPLQRAHDTYLSDYCEEKEKITKWDDVFYTTPVKQPGSITTSAATVLLQSLSSIYGEQSDYNSTLMHTGSSNKFVIERTQELLSTCNRSLIWKILKSGRDGLMMELKNLILDCQNSNSNPRINEDDIAKLHFVHVMTEIQNAQQKNKVKKLKALISKKKQNLFTIMVTKKFWEDTDKQKERFDAILHDVSVNAALEMLKKELNTALKEEEMNKDLTMIVNKLINTHNLISKQVSTIENYSDCIMKIMKKISYIREEAASSVYRLHNFTSDLSWADPLKTHIFTLEVNIFKTFPLEYNRKFCYTQSKNFYRNIPSKLIPSGLEIDSDEVYLIGSILDNPFSPAETILLNFIKAKMKLKALKSLPKRFTNVEFKKYSLKELNSQESYVQYALDKLSALIYSNSTTKTLSSAAVMKETMRIWSEMPLKDFISNKLLVNGHPFDYYEKKYNTFYNSM